MKKRISLALAFALLFSSLCFSACNGGEETFTLRVGSWDEYIDEGGEDSWVEGSAPLYEEFEDWYYQTYNKRVKVEYVTLQDNETMYNKIQMGDKYDLLCPSEYMMMKLAAENKLQPYPESFFDTTIEENYYAKYLSPFIKEEFEKGKMENGKSWAEYGAGYMWGTTGFVINPENVDREDAKSWKIFQNPKYHRLITAKDNVRDTYFTGLGMLFEEELLTLKKCYQTGDITLFEYQSTLTELMNKTDPSTMNAVREELVVMRNNLYGLETDEGKMDIITGKFDVSYQWSGDGVYVLDKAEEYGLELEYVIPEAASNLWFDAWVMMKGINEEKMHAATAFVNFLSMPENVVRNMYYIGYTSCISGATTGENEIFSYLQEMYGVDETEEDKVEYCLDYFFGEEHTIITSPDQVRRQLFAQYPDEKTKESLVVMKYFKKEVNELANRIWITIK